METVKIGKVQAAHPDAPSLLYLPGVHGDCTLIRSFSARISGQVECIEATYPRTINWDLRDYAAAVESALCQAGISTTWILGESFSSQIAWILLDAQRRGEARVRYEGVILAGGFVRHPSGLMVRMARRILEQMSGSRVKRCLGVYRLYSRFRHRRAPETLAAVPEFIERRTPEDIRAMVHRLDLIYRNDPCELAAKVEIPVFALSGYIDPVVPWWSVFGWLEKNCPGFREAKTIWPGDHNVLGTEPAKSAEMIMGWISKERSTGVK